MLLIVDALKTLSKRVAVLLHNYMTALKYIGYKRYCTVDKLLVFLFIEEMVNDESIIVTKEDFNSIVKVMNCLQEPCTSSSS